MNDSRLLFLPPLFFYGGFENCKCIILVNGKTGAFTKWKMFKTHISLYENQTKKSHQIQTFPKYSPQNNLSLALNAKIVPSNGLHFWMLLMASTSSSSELQRNHLKVWFSRQVSSSKIT
jgi:hypothetical protein